MLRKKKYRYAAGGDIDPVSMVAMAQQFGTGLVDAIAPANEFGHQSPLAMAMKGSTQLGPIGAVAGYLKGRKLQRQDKIMRTQNEYDTRNQQFARSGAIISTDPALVTGYRNAELYANGGFLKNQYYNAVKTSGGTLQPLSKNSAQVQGPSHGQGGVDLPQFNSELEGGETLQNNYVFSKRLGFADEHKKLARAIGKIEQKPATRERITSLKMLHKRVEDLKQAQEAIRQQYNLE